MTVQTRRSGRVRVLGSDDLAQVIKVLSANPVENVFVASRVRSAGLERTGLGCSLWGYERAGTLRSLFHAGSNLMPIAADDEAIDAWVTQAGEHRRCSSIIGSSASVMALWQHLSATWGSAWAEPREVRPHQPVMALDTGPTVAPNLDIHRITLDHWDSYTEAAIAMYTEEVGVSPVQDNPAGYRFYVRQLITSGRAFGLLDGDRVIFKADIGSVSGTVCQVQGVWLTPELRGRGLAGPAMAGVVQLARSVAPTVTLYVNHYNLPARRTYARVGFRDVGEFATIHY